MFYCIITSRVENPQVRALAQENNMLIVELNFAGFHFSREIPDLRHSSLRSGRLGQRAMQWRLPHLRHPHAA
jgi:hypothetical protein